MLLTPLAVAVATALWCGDLAVAHVVMTYPGWRGNNLHTNGTNPDGSVPTGALGIDYREDGTVGFPYGMQWMYPCGGLPTTTNRTKWPVTGGAVGWQPGWFPGHSSALMYVNLGLGTEPPNMSHPMVPVFSITGPTNNMYPGSICLLQVPLPANISVNVGDNATIQVIETAQHGAALYSCVDITFAEPEDVDEVNETNCFNSTSSDGRVNFQTVFTTQSLSAANSMLRINSLAATLPTLGVLVFAFLIL